MKRLAIYILLALLAGALGTLVLKCVAPDVAQGIHPKG
jgi:hypothetical protein